MVVTSRRVKRQVKKNTMNVDTMQRNGRMVFRRRLGKSKVGTSGTGGGSTRAICTADAGSGNTIAATLFNSDGTTGEAVTVYCNLPSVITDLSEASPLLEEDYSIIYVNQINIDNAGTPVSQWECVQLFDVTEECECTTP